MEAVYFSMANSQNRLKMAQGLLIKRNFQQAAEVAHKVSEDLKEFSTNDDVVQLLCVALGIISEAHESLGDYQKAAEYKKTQREFLEYVRDSQVDEDEEREVLSPQARKKLILRKLDALNNMSLDPFDPQGSMEKILKSMQKAKQQRMADAIDSLNTTGHKSTHEGTIMDWLFEHPVITGLLVVILMLTLVMILIHFLTPHTRPSAETEKKMRELINQFSQNAREL